MTCRLADGGWLQRVDGYRASLVAGTPVFENGSDTGARPGRLVRAAQ
jgi:N-acyl-D-aspartate/D-glutamate deacylase